MATSSEENAASAQPTEELVPQSIADFLQARGIWATTTPPNNYYLGDAIEVILEQAYPPAAKPECPAGPQYLPLKMCLLGAPFAGKKTVLKKLTELYGLKHYDMATIEEEAKKVIDRKNEPEDNRKKKAPEEEPAVFVEACCNSSDNPAIRKASLFRARIRGQLGDQPPQEEEVKKPGKKEEVKCQGFALVGYPTTVEQAKALECELSAFIHPNDLPEPVASVKKREATVLAKPTPKPPSKKQVFESFFDMVVLLDIPLETSLLRGLDRRVDPAGNIYNMNINPPPDNLLAKCKPIERPTKEEIEEMSEAHEANKEELRLWFEEFGIEHWNWKTVISLETSQPVEDTIETILNKAKELVEIKADPPPPPELVETIKFRDQDVLLPQEEAASLAAEWERLKADYLAVLEDSLGQVDSHYHQFVDNLLSLANTFTAYLLREDSKIYIAEGYYASIKKLIGAKSRLFGKQVATFHNTLDEMINALWDVVDAKKEESIVYRCSLLEANDIKKEFAGILALASHLVNAEIRRYAAIYALLGKFQQVVFQEEVAEGSFADAVLDTSLPIEENGSFPALEDLMAQAKRACVSSEWMAQANEVLLFRLGVVEKWTKDSLVFYQRKNSQLFDMMDEWITSIVAEENRTINAFAKAIESAIANAEPVPDFHFPGNEELKTVLSDFTAQ